jgi:hypothetical protein
MFALLLLVWLAVLGATTWLAVSFREWLPLMVGGGFAALFLSWVLGCAFSPAVPDRRCPKCKREGLVRLRKHQMLGVRCVRCGYVNPELYRAYLDEV